MSTQVQIRRGTTAGHASFTGAVAELTYDSDLKTIRAHDGSTAGGIVLAKASDVTTVSNSIALKANSADLTTANVTEVTNLYYTVARANTAIDNRVTKAFVDALGVDATTLDGIDSLPFAKDVDLTTANVTEITNLYYTVARANTAIDNRVTKVFIDNLNVDADTLDGNDSSYFAPVSSPSLTGTPLAPTASPGTNTTQIATTAFVTTAVANIVDAAPEALNTLNELAAALGDDANYATTTATLIGTANTNALAAFAQANVATVNASAAFDSANTKVASVAGVTSTSISNTVLLAGVVAADAYSLLPIAFSSGEISSATAVFTFSKSTYRAAEVLFTIHNNGGYKVVKTLVIHQGSTVTFGDNYLDDNEVAINDINTTYTFDSSGDNIRLVVTPTSGTCTVKGKASLIAI